MEMPATRLQRRKGVAYYMILLLACSSLCMGLGSCFLLLWIRNNTAANAPQPYAATPGDLDAEKLAQRNKLTELGVDVKPRNKSVPAATIGPVGEPLPTKQLGEKPEAPEVIPPRKRVKPSMQRAKPPPATNPLTPESDPSSMEDPFSPEQRNVLRFQKSDFFFELDGLEKHLAHVTDTNKLLFNYLADEIATIHVETRKIDSRMAVVEYAIKQLQELSVVFWLNVLGTVVGALQGLVTLYEFSRDRWRVRQTGTAA